MLDDPLYAYELLLDVARRSPPLPDSERTVARRVRGCQSNAWLKLEAREGVFFLEGDSDTLVIRGILALVAEVLNGAPCALVAETPLDFLQEAGVTDTFDAARRTGLAAVAETIRSFAAHPNPSR
nr:SufE family protein [Adlercreutzia sp. JBNU-10]